MLMVSIMCITGSGRLLLKNNSLANFNVIHKEWDSLEEEHEVSVTSKNLRFFYMYSNKVLQLSSAALVQVHTRGLQFWLSCTTKEKSSRGAAPPDSARPHCKTLPFDWPRTGLMLYPLALPPVKTKKFLNNTSVVVCNLYSVTHQLSTGNTSGQT
jgi:hypothetical protein